jgi:hypothetical protein
MLGRLYGPESLNIQTITQPWGAASDDVCDQPGMTAIGGLGLSNAGSTDRTTSRSAQQREPA